MRWWSPPCSSPGGALDLLVLSILCFLRLRPAPARPRARLARRFALLALPVWLVPGCVLLLTPHTSGNCSSGKVRCVNNVRQMSTILSELARDREWPPYDGKNFVLSLVVDGVIDPTRVKNLELFFCPEDERHRLDEAGLERFRQLAPELLLERRFPELTSYAGLRREGRAAYQASGVVPIIGCRHDFDGVALGLSNGSARYLDREDLGLGRDDPLVFGEASPSPLLRHLSGE